MRGVPKQTIYLVYEKPISENEYPKQVGAFTRRDLAEQYIETISKRFHQDKENYILTEKK